MTAGVNSTCMCECLAHGGDIRHDDARLFHHKRLDGLSGALPLPENESPAKAKTSRRLPLAR